MDTSEVQPLSPNRLRPPSEVEKLTGNEMQAKIQGGLSVLMKGMGISSKSLFHSASASSTKCQGFDMSTLEYEPYEDAPGMDALHKASLEVEDLTRKIEQHKCEQQALKTKYEAVERDLMQRRKDMSKLALKTEGYQRLHRLKSVQVEDLNIKSNNAMVKLNRTYEINRSHRDAINEYRMRAMLDTVEYDELKNELEECHKKREKLERKVDDEQAQALDDADDIRDKHRSLRRQIDNAKALYESLHAELNTDNERARLGKYDGDVDMGKQTSKKRHSQSGSKDNTAAERVKHSFERFRLDKKKTAIDLHAKNSPLFSRAADLFNKGTKNVKAGDLTVEEEAGLRVAISTGKWIMQRGKNTLNELENKLQSYEEAFRYIQKHTGVKTTAELVETFVNQEEENFRMFTTVNDLSAEIEETEHEIEDLRLEMEKFLGKDHDAQDGQSIVKLLERKEVLVKQRMTRDENQIEQLTHLLSSIKDSISSLFLSIGCDPSIVKELLEAKKKKDLFTTTTSSLISQPTNESSNAQKIIEPDSASNSLVIDEHSVLQYLGLIEARVAEIIIRYNLMAKQEGNFDPAFETRTQISAASSKRSMRGSRSSRIRNSIEKVKLKLAPRTLPSADTMDDWSDEDDPILHPMTHGELLRKFEERNSYPVANKRRSSRSTIVNSK